MIKINNHTEEKSMKLMRIITIVIVVVAIALTGCAGAGRGRDGNYGRPNWFDSVFEDTNFIYHYGSSQQATSVAAERGAITNARGVATTAIKAMVLDFSRENLRSSGIGEDADVLNSIETVTESIARNILANTNPTNRHVHRVGDRNYIGYVQLSVSKRGIYSGLAAELERNRHIQHAQELAAEAHALADRFGL